SFLEVIDIGVPGDLAVVAAVFFAGLWIHSLTVDQRIPRPQNRRTGRHKSELYPRFHRHIVEWVLIALLLRGAYDVIRGAVIMLPTAAPVAETRAAQQPQT